MPLTNTNNTDTDGKYYEGQLPNTVCFVPQNCINPNGSLNINNYVTNGWAQKNAYANYLKIIGSHIYPRLDKPTKKPKTWRVT
jgi:hypothetical protein